MKNCIRTIVLGVLPAIAASLSACTEVDDLLGAGMVPGNQQMTVSIATLDGILTYQSVVDSVASKDMAVALVGRDRDATYGKTGASAMLQYVPGYFANDDYYGFRPVADSLSLTLNIADGFGDTINAKQKFNIYKLIKPLHKDSSYYSNIDVEEFTGENMVKLFSFEYQGGVNGNYKTRLSSHNSSGEMVVDANFTAEGLQLLNDLVAADNELYGHDTLFLNRFNGFYIAPDDASPEAAALYQITLSSSYLTVYAHNKDEENYLENKDTLSVNYFFDDASYYYSSSVNRIEHDYTGTPVETEILKGRGGQTSSVMFVHSPVGVMPALEFPEDLVDRVNALLTVTDPDTHVQTEYSTMVINKAQIMISLANKGMPYIDRAAGRLGMYTSYHELVPISDYSPSYESQGYSLPYGGYLVRSKGYYSMDITSFLQDMVTNTKKKAAGQDVEVENRIEMAAPPDVASTLGFSRAELSGLGGQYPVELKLTYTLIK